MSQQEKNQSQSQAVAENTRTRPVVAPPVDVVVVATGPPPTTPDFAATVTPTATSTPMTSAAPRPTHRPVRRGGGAGTGPIDCATGPLAIESAPNDAADCTL